MCALLAAAFAFPTGWSCGTIFQHWRSRTRGGDQPNPFHDRPLMAAWLTLVLLVALYSLGLSELIILANRAAAVRIQEHHAPAPPP
jgi:hypothetical protein